MTVSACRPRVRLFALGGTIAAPVDGAEGDPFSVTAAQLLAAVPAVGVVAQVSGGSFLATASAALRFEDVRRLAAAIEESVREGAEGVVVTQGTDTLEETAFLLDLLLQVDVPVVVTGAMRNAGTPGEDGPANLLAAVRVAASPLAAGLGVLVVLDDRIHLARLVQKTHTSATGAFGSPTLGPVGWLVEDRVRVPLVPRTREPRIEVLAQGAPPAVALVRLALDDRGRALRATSAAGYDGVVVETFGAGHVSPDDLTEIEHLAAVRPVVFASRTGAGELYRSTGRFRGSEQDLLAAGAVSANSLDGVKARVLLTALLWSSADIDSIRARFASVSG